MAQRRTRVILAQLRASAADPALIEMTGQLQTCEEKLRVIISTQTCAQKLIRLGAMDAMTGMDTAAADGKLLKLASSELQRAHTHSSLIDSRSH